MRIGHRLATFVVALTATLAATSSPAQTTALVTQSDLGDPVGVGVNQNWTPATASFTASMFSFPSGVSVYVRTPSYSSWWSVRLSAPEGTQLAVGVYESAHRSNSATAGLDVSGNGRGCSRTVGRFEVLELVYTADGTIARFAADFEQHCDGADAALIGAIRFNSTIGSVEPFGGVRDRSLTIAPPTSGTVTATNIACDGGRTDCSEAYAFPTTVTLTATPDAGYRFMGWTGDCTGGTATLDVRVNRRMSCAAWFGAVPGGPGTDPTLLGKAVVYLDGQPNAYALPGRQLFFRSDAGAAFPAPVASSSYIEMTADNGVDSLRVAFRAPQGTSLVPGAYEYTVAAYKSSTLAPGLSLSVGGNGCGGSSRGRFVIYDIEVVGTTLQRLAADFEQFCGSAPIAGAVRFNTTRGALVPFDGAYPAYALHVASERGGTIVATNINCGVDCGESYRTPTDVGLTALPDLGFVFAAWADDCSGGAATVNVTVNQMKRCTAIFSPEASTITTPLDTSTLLFDSDAGDYIGGGARSAWSGRTSMFTVWVATTSRIQVSVDTPDGESWRLDMAAPSGQPFASGQTYEYATRYPFQSPFVPGLDIGGHGRGCNTLRGRFVIYELSFTTEGALASLAADVEQHCGGGRPALFSSLRINANRASLLPFDGDYPTYQLQVVAERGGRVTGAGIDCGGDCVERYPVAGEVSLAAAPDSGFAFLGWGEDCAGDATTIVTVDQRKRCTAVFSPLPGTLAAPLDTDILFFDSDPGDYIGAGKRSVWTGRTSVFTVLSATGSLVRVKVSTFDGEEWTVSLAPPAGDVLQSGRTYNFATRWPFQVQAAPGLDIDGHGRGCNALSGRFTLHEMALGSGDTLAALAVDFEQHCEGAQVALRGSLRYHSARADLFPYRDESPSTLLFRHRVSGDLIAWYMTGTTRVSTRVPSPARVQTNWRLAGTGDFNSDAASDFLWQEETTGDLVVWLMNGAWMYRTAYPSISIPRPKDPEWKVVSVADMNADGKPDLVWQHSVTAALAVWYLDGTTVIGQLSTDPWKIADPNWKLVSATDFDGDGKSDFLWRHATEGYLFVWYMDGVTRSGYDWLYPAQLKDLGWQVISTRDVNADGKVDIILQHADGRMIAWFMDGVIRIGYQMLTPDHVKDPNWRIIGPR